VKERYWSKQNKQTVDLKTWTAKELGFPAFAILFIGNFVKTHVTLKLEIRFINNTKKGIHQNSTNKEKARKCVGSLDGFS
jgi:hypothetical protein